MTPKPEPKHKMPPGVPSPEAVIGMEIIRAVELAKPEPQRDQNAVKGREVTTDEWVKLHSCPKCGLLMLPPKRFWAVEKNDAINYAGKHVFVRHADVCNKVCKLSKLAAEREAWQKQYDKKFAEWVAAINRLNELAGEHRVTLAALAKAETTITAYKTALASLNITEDDDEIDGYGKTLDVIDKMKAIK